VREVKINLIPTIVRVAGMTMTCGTNRRMSGGKPKALQRRVPGKKTIASRKKSRNMEI
jgi:hypothetical protein